MSKIDELCRFNDFTFLNYESLLELAKQKYKFVTFDENQNFKNKIILLRHDVEFSVPIALKMARIETSLGIRATYFVQLHGDFYNALEKETFQNLKQIESLGHKLALHFDPHFWNITDEKQLEEYLLIDKTTFEQYFNVAPIAFSFHNNNSFTLSCEKELYAGILNVYSKK